MARLSQIRPVSLREQVVEQIRNAIIERTLSPGDRITEIQLTEELGVSRTPVREALILLEREGLVVSLPNRRLMVRAFTERDVDDIFSMRTTLENFAGELIIHQMSSADIAYLHASVAQQRDAIEQHDFKRVRSIDMDFHRFLVNRSQHTLLIRQWTEIVAQIAAMLYLRAEAIPDYDEYYAINDHAAIITAYEQRDIQKLRDLNNQINQRVASECRLGVAHHNRTRSK